MLDERTESTVPALWSIPAVLSIPFAIWSSPVGIVLAIIGIHATRGGVRRGRGLSVAGLVVGIANAVAVTTVLFTLFAIYILIPATGGN